MKHLANWIEIPVINLDRAIEFYSKILGVEFHRMEIGPIKYAIFPSDDSFNCGALVQGESYSPSDNGIIVYLDGGEDLDKILQKVETADGQIVMKKTFLSSEAGYIGFFIDTEGNRVGLQNP
ncbi:glyoxalase-like domain protein [Leptospira broomii serovar Hurstbridge str. 5399]|uniref:Glyoxalase-like domain protein n=1 Tax=Leptospira broomii serovar Hurstbridge str. 5399 TaxID=1049789 RepID=T0FCF4_9LEPT|nr:VOC family protein [Leptospira broomii]EQA45282.1 glyoxalase-like domain protein [Leptospira broomii serovar Hurstbridge str. 5399]